MVVVGKINNPAFPGLEAVALTLAVPSSLCCRHALARRCGRGVKRSETRSSRAAAWSLAHTGCLGVKKNTEIPIKTDVEKSTVTDQR